MSFILNLTQYPATANQRLKGVVDLKDEDFALLKSLISFGDVGYIPTKEDIRKRAALIAELAVGAAECTTCARIGGYCGESCNGAANWFRGRALVDGPAYMLVEIVKALEAARFDVSYPYTEGVVTETTSPSGEVTRTEVFRHLGFVEC